MRGRATRARGAKGLTIGLRETQAAPRAHLRCARRAIAGVDGGIGLRHGGRAHDEAHAEGQRARQQGAAG